MTARIQMTAISKDGIGLAIVEAEEKNKGDTGFHVFLLQCALVYKGYHFGYSDDNEKRIIHLLGLDGIFGESTENALLDYQKNAGIVPTGKLDYLTAEILFSEEE